MSKNPAYRTHRISWPMRIVAPTFFPLCRQQRGWKTFFFFSSLNISGVCLQISSMCLEIWIVHKVVLFLTYDTKISRLLKVSCVCPEIYSVCKKISRLVQIYGLCPEISSSCPETLIVQKYYIYFGRIA